MTSIHETLEYFHEKMNQLNTRAHESSAVIQRLAEQVQQLSTRTHKTKASTKQEEPTVDELSAGAPEPEPEAPVTEKPDVLSMLYRRFSSEPVREPPRSPYRSQCQSRSRIFSRSGRIQNQYTFAGFQSNS